MEVSLSEKIEQLFVSKYNQFRDAIIIQRRSLTRPDFFQDSLGRECHTSHRGDGTYDVYEWREKRFADGGHVRGLGAFSIEEGLLFTILLKYVVLFSNLERGEFFIDNLSVANTNEIRDYQERYRDSFGNRRRRREFINRLNAEARCNVFRWDIIPKKTISQGYEKDDITKLMERIEVLLIRLRDYNGEQYAKYSAKYNELINQEDSKLQFPITKPILESIEAGILLSFYFNKNNGNNILEFLEIKKKEYLENLLNKEGKTSITIHDIDKIMELYLRSQNDYDSITKRKITRNIGLLYLLELLENRPLSLNEDIKKSYIKDNITNIILAIKTLEELEIIHYDVVIDLSYDYQLEELLAIINTIKINDNIEEKIKRL